MERVPDFCQTDLTYDAAFIVDGYLKVHLWIGSSCVESIANAASKFAEEYSKLASRDRDMTVDVIAEEHGRESLVFQHLFMGWEASLFVTPDHESDPYEISKKKIRDMREADIVRSQMLLKEKQQVRGEGGRE